MKGYVAVTTPKWFQYQKLHNNKSAIFWRKSERQSNLNPGDYFFFLPKGRLPRPIQGYGVVEHIKKNTIQELWNIYGQLTGADTLIELEILSNKKYYEKVIYYEIGNIIYLDKNKFVYDSEIDFKKDIMTGKFYFDTFVYFLLNKFK
jgi:hypothetical protein